MQRRQFLLCSGASMALLACSPWPALASGRRIALHEVSYEDFTRALNSRFEVHIAGRDPVALRLIRTETRQSPRMENPKAAGARFERFSLVFAGPTNHVLPQENYTFVHPRLGRFEMFIVPTVARDPAARRYEAVFNRPVPT